MGKHRHKPKVKPKPRAPKARHCEACGEKEQLRSLVVAVDGRAVAKRRLCRACTAVTCVALLPPTHGGWAR